MKKIIGIAMLAMFFGAILAAITIQIGLIMTATIFGLTIICTAWIVGAIRLILD